MATGLSCRVRINGTTHEVPAGLTLRDALALAGTPVPGVCQDPRVLSGGDCRLCSVLIEGEPGPVVACRRPVADGLSVETHTPALEAFRRTLLEMLAERCSADSAAALPEKELHHWLAAYAVRPAAGVTADEAADPGLPPAPARAPDTSHPYIRVDMSQCIRCYRCVRICDDLQGQFVWHVLGRGHDGRVVFDRGERFIDSSCVSCGACADTCPTGALVDVTRLSLGAADHWVPTTCTYCGVGCELDAGVRDGRMVGVRPVLQAPVSQGHLCAKGRYAWNFGMAEDRVTVPRLRTGGAWRDVPFTEAVGHAAAELRRIIGAYGPDSVGVLGSARATNEENYLAQKFARLVIGTNNVDCCARVCHAPTAAAMKHMLGTGAATNSYDDIENARTILVAGANATGSHPVVGARIRQQVRRGARLIIIDPRRTELAALATVHLALRPGTNIPLLNALAHVIVTEHLADEAFIRRRVDGYEAFRRFITAWTPERAAEICGVDGALIRTAARLYAGSGPAMAFHGLGLTEHLQGTESVMALVNLALLTGNLGRRGSGINPLRGQNNVQGAAVMGCEPDSLTGGQPIGSVRNRFEAVWQATLPTTAGLNLMQMMDAAADGRLKALYVIGYDVLLTLADTTRVREALGRLELVIVQDLFENETAREFGTVFLPVASAFEKDGTFMNAERRIQPVRRAIPPPAGVASDLAVIQAMATALDHPAGFAFGSPAQVWEEIRRVWPAVAGISHERLSSGGIQWPCPDEHHPGTPLLHQESFAGRARAALERIDYVASPEHISGEYPFLLTTGRDLHQFNAGTMTGRTDQNVLRPDDTLDMAPADALRVGFAEGETVRVVSRHGAITLPLRLHSAVQPGQLFASFHSPARFVNRLTGQVRDRRVGTPEYKVTAVRVERQSV